MSYTSIKWMLRARSIKLYTNRRAKNNNIDLKRFNIRGTTSPTEDLKRFNTRGTTSPPYINSFVVSRYLSKNLPNFFKVDTEVGLFKDSCVKPLSTFGNHRPDGKLAISFRQTVLPSPDTQQLSQSCKGSWKIIY